MVVEWAAGCVRNTHRYRRQLWLVGERPIPRKMAVASKTIDNAPQYTLQIGDCKIGVESATNAFPLKALADARMLGADALREFDELSWSSDKGKMP
jgi:hypothetical protein